MEIRGNFNAAKVFTSVVDDKSIEQIRTLCDQEFVRDAKIRMMPDVMPVPAARSGRR